MVERRRHHFIKRGSLRPAIPRLARLCAAALLTVGGGCTDSPSADSGGGPAPPNVVIVLADDLGYGDIGPYGQTKIDTPHLDALADEGLTFTQHYAGSTICAPSRASLMTGLHTGHVEIRGNRGVGDYTDDNEQGQMALPGHHQTIAELLSAAGYRTGLVGKWGLGGPRNGESPLRHGFDHYFGYLDQKQAHNYYPTHLWRNDVSVPLDNPFFIPHPNMTGGSTDPADYLDYAGGDYAPDRLIEEALAFVGSEPGRPFFLLYAPTLPHAALQVPDRYVEHYDGRWQDLPTNGGGYTPHPRARAARAAMITRLDEEVGRLRARFRELGVAGNTLFIFTSDNGPASEGGQDLAFFEAAGGLRGKKRDLYEGGIRVPLIAHWPGVTPEGQRTDHVSAQWDLLPTLAAFAGRPPEANIDGLSFADVLRHGRQEAQHDYLYWEFHERTPAQAVRKGRWKAVRLFPDGYDDAAPIELYDLETDPEERTDLADSRPAQLHTLRELLGTARTPSEAFNFETAE